ncbi:MAG TPA: SPFH domain-containing protein [Planctomycetaceae bacterium]|jgi:regulator of protease activity HflC (stomatin/prohibitin superfamily)|nr:SPFH domain-containing protein [Planctomycetaceae bacterium]
MSQPMVTEKLYPVQSGWTMLFVNIAGAVLALILLVVGATLQSPVLIIFALLLAVAVVISSIGLFAQQPNLARVMLLFGEYRGTVRETGFFWANPFVIRKPISLRLRNLEGSLLKVNDKQGNPIEIAAVVVWRVEDSARATFNVADYTTYVRVQSESAVRHLANSYAYDHGEEHEITLRSGVDEVSAALKAELQTRLAEAGVVVEEARLTHLAYAPEIAGAMLRRQQADAIIAARQKIVHGAVSIVEMALSDLSQRNVLTLNDERRAAMVSNLLVVLCSEQNAQPVVSTGVSTP